MTTIYELHTTERPRETVLRTTDRAEADRTTAVYERMGRPVHLHEWAPTVGQQVYWLYTARGGYGYTRAVPVVVIEIRGETAKVQVEADPKVRRWIRIHNLKEREATS